MDEVMYAYLLAIRQTLQKWGPGNAVQGGNGGTQQEREKVRRNSRE